MGRDYRPTRKEAEGKDSRSGELWAGWAGNGRKKRKSNEDFDRIFGSLNKAYLGVCFNHIF